MLIERMQTNPEDFNYGGKLYRVTENAQMSARDKKAISEAHDTYIKEPRLMVHVLESLLVQPEEENVKMTYRPAMTLGSSGNLGIGTQGRYATGHMDARGLWAAPVKNEGQPIFDPTTDSYVLADQQRITREMYENHIQAHKSPIKRHIQAVAAAQIHNKFFSDRIERDT